MSTFDVLLTRTRILATGRSIGSSGLEVSFGEAQPLHHQEARRA